jgi:hypothetical protein
MITDREQIHDLAKSTGCQIVKNAMGNPMFTMTTYELQQYTEMVARTAIGVVQKRFMGDLNREDMEVKRCVEDLMKHFGVEL